jgi:putative intracellular protease/amidase
MSVKKPIAVVLESHYDPTELPAFSMFFPANGYAVQLISDLHGHPSATFRDNDGGGAVTVTTDLDRVNPADFSAIVLIGGYAMDMLRFEVFVEAGVPDEPKATRFLRKVMATKNLIVGTICHSLWLFTPAPDLLRGRKVTCSHNILFDVRNAGAELVYDAKTRMLADVHVDGNLVTARHPYVVQAFMNTLVAEANRRQL